MSNKISISRATVNTNGVFYGPPTAYYPGHFGAGGSAASPDWTYRPVIGDGISYPYPGNPIPSIPYGPGGDPWKDISKTFDEWDTLVKATKAGVVRSQVEWRVSELEEEGVKCASTDFPGVHPEMIDVSMEDGVVTIKGIRYDTNDAVEKSVDVGKEFDPTTADAILDHGVFTIRIQKFKNSVPRKIKVRSGEE